MRAFLGKLGLVLLGFVLSAAVMEVGLRLFAPQIFEVHPPHLYTLDDDVGYVLTPGFTGELVRPEFETQVTVNSAGLRGPELRPRQPNTRRILLLGDSQTWGFGVEDGETYAVRLEPLLAEQYPQLDIQVLNGGVPGYGTADQLHFLQSRFADLQPDLIVVQFLSVNDLQENRNPASSWATIIDGMLARGEANPAAEVAAPLWVRGQGWLKQNSHLGRLLLDVGGYWAARAGLLNDAAGLWGEDFSEADRALGVDYLTQIAAFAGEREVPVLFLYTTAQVHVLPATYEQPPSAAVVRAAAEQSDVPWIDVAAVLHGHPERETLYYVQNGHWTAAGHAAIADLLLEIIGERGLLQP